MQNIPRFSAMTVMPALMIVAIAFFVKYYPWEEHTDLKRMVDWNATWGNTEGRKEPFKVAVDPADLDDLQRRILQARIAPTRMEGDPEEENWSYGTDGEFLRELQGRWAGAYLAKWSSEFEPALNAHPQFTTVVQGLRIHYQHAKTKKKGAPTILLLHGWPSSIVEFSSLIPLLTHDPTTPFNVVSVSLPGFGWSEAPSKKGFGLPQAAVLLIQFMRQTFPGTKYLVHGGDWGALIANAMAQLAPEDLEGMHVTWMIEMLPMRSIVESLGLSAHGLLFSGSSQFLANARFLWEESGYLHIHATKPHSLGHALTDSPLGLAAWIVEKYWSWTDNPAARQHKSSPFPLPLDPILTNIMVYWVTGSASTSMRFFRETYDQPLSSAQAACGGVDSVPTAVAVFPHDPAAQKIWGSPVRSAKNKFRDLRQITTMDAGGHFPAIEQPAMLHKDIVSFYSKL